MVKKRETFLIIAVAIIVLMIGVIHPSALDTPTETSITYCASGDEGRLLINWKVVNVDGYELMLAQNSTFTRNPQTLTYSGDRRKASLTDLKKFVVYYVKVRTYNEENGQKIYSNWSEVKSVRIHSHNYKRTLTTKPTCTENGAYTFVCSECRRFYKEPAQALGHSYKWTDNGDGTMSYKCERCGDVTDTKDCVFELTKTINPTCTEDGYNEYICNDCGAIKKDTISKLNHNYELNETSTEKIYTCVNCGDTYTEKKEETKKDEIVDNNTNENANVDQEYTIDIGNGQTTTVKGHFETEMEESIFEQLNEYRRENGLAELNKGSDALKDGANLRATEITYLFDHKRPNGERALTSLTSTTRCCAENLAKYQKTVDEVMKDWKASSSHNSIMLSKSPKTVSISVFAKYERTVANKPVYSYHFVQFFGW